MRKDIMSGEYGGNVENFKRRRALPPTPKESQDTKFFQRILNGKRMENMVFITKTIARDR